MGTTDPAANLVELGQPEGVGPVDDDRVGAGDVEAGLDDRGGDQEVALPVHEPEHGLLERALWHLAVRHADTSLGDDLAQPPRHGVDVLYPVVDEEDLAAAAELA